MLEVARRAVVVTGLCFPRRRLVAALRATVLIDTRGLRAVFEPIDFDDFFAVLFTDDLRAMIRASCLSKMLVSCAKLIPSFTFVP